MKYYSCIGPIYRKLKWKFSMQKQELGVVERNSSLQEINVIYFIRVLWFEATSQETTVSHWQKENFFPISILKQQETYFRHVIFIFLCFIFFFRLFPFFASSPFPTRFLFIQETTISCDILPNDIYSWILNLLPQTDKNVLII